jgi:hypothetical protein
MADLNKTMQELQKRFFRIKGELRTLLDDYDGTFREVNKIYMDEKMASGTMEGLEDFYRLLQVMRRNRDVIGSLMRGANSLRPVDKFKFVEEDVPKLDKNKKRNKSSKKRSAANVSRGFVSGGVVEFDEKVEELV